MRARLAQLVLFVLLVSITLPALADPADRFAEAQALMYDGRLDEALVVLDVLQSEYPADVDYAFSRAQVLSRLGHDDDALDQLELAVALAPGYEDVWRTRYALLTRQDNADELEDFRRRASEQFPQSTWWRQPEPVYRPAWTLLVGAGADSLSNGLPGWDNQFVEAHYEHGENALYTARIARDARNDVGDISFGLGGEWRTHDWTTGAAITFVADPEFQSRAGFEARIGRSLGGGWNGTIRYRHRGYDNATIGTIVADVEKYLSDFRLAYTLGVSHLEDASSFSSHTLTSNWYYRDSSSVGVSLSGGREAEAIGGGRVIETDVRGISLTGRHQFNHRLGLHWWLGVHEQGDLYRRRFVGMAVSIGI